MLLQRFNSMVPVPLFGDEMDRVITHAFDGFPSTRAFRPFARNAAPAFNVWKDDKNVFVEAEVPGMNPDELQVTVQDDMLTISGEQKSEREEQGDYITQERVHRKFSRTVQLPGPVAENDDISATLKGGVLKVTVPKSPKLLPRKIEIKD
ncbi:MAG: Hsp20/alpha crystallin family protein [Phycisphaerae bacterium]